MKKVVKIIATLVLINIFSANLMADNLRFVNKEGIEFFIPIKKEIEEPIPTFIKKETSTFHIIFDISEIIKPESEEEVPDFIKKLMNNLD